VARAEEKSEEDRGTNLVNTGDARDIWNETSLD
jgi:hypothetical protein